MWSQLSRWGVGNTKILRGRKTISDLEMSSGIKCSSSPSVCLSESDGAWSCSFLIWQWKYHFILLMPRASLSSAETSLPKTRLKTPAQASGSFLTASSVISLLCVAQVCVCVYVSFLYQIHMWQSPHSVSMKWRPEGSDSLICLFSEKGFHSFWVWMSWVRPLIQNPTKPTECWSLVSLNENK